jgi:hypothetical protein
MTYISIANISAQCMRHDMGYLQSLWFARQASNTIFINFE